MVDRQEVEALLDEVHSMAETNRVAIGDIAHAVDGDTLAALCRAWLAVDAGAPAIMDTRAALSVCAPTEDDFPALYALQGQRVRIVREVGDA